MTSRITIPTMPPSRREGEDGGRADLPVRYEDVSQDGRVQLTSIMWGLGHVVWRELLGKMPVLATFRAQGVLPILRRLVAVGEDRSVSVNLPISYEGSFRFAHEEGGDRLFANMWLAAHAPIASTLFPTPPGDGKAEPLARVFAEHVVTKPFAPAGERKVTRLEAPGLPPVPEDPHVFEATEAMIEGAPLEPAGDILFGMMHTDSNQHVNSLVYPRVFEELAVRKLASTHHPKASSLMMRSLELRWRKPFFAGERAQVSMRFDETTDGLVAVGAFGDVTKPHCTVRILMR